MNVIFIIIMLLLTRYLYIHDMVFHAILCT